MNSITHPNQAGATTKRAASSLVKILVGSGGFFELIYMLTSLSSVRRILNRAAAGRKQATVESSEDGGQSNEAGYSRNPCALAGLLLFWFMTPQSAVWRTPTSRPIRSPAHQRCEVFIYKDDPQHHLRFTFQLAGRKAGVKSPAVVFFYGGGFILATSAGSSRRPRTGVAWLVTVLVDYRVKCREPSTTIMDEIADAKSAMRGFAGHADNSASILRGLPRSEVRERRVDGRHGAHFGFRNDPAGDKKIDPRPNHSFFTIPGPIPGRSSLTICWRSMVGKASADHATSFRLSISPRACLPRSSSR